MHPDQGVLPSGHLALDQGHVVLPVQHRLVGVHGELAEVGGDPGVGDAPDQLVLVPAVPDEVGDRDQVEAVLLGEALELGQSGHARLVLADHLAQHTGRGHARRPGQVHGRLGVPGPLQHPSRSVPEGEDVPGAVEVGGPDMGVGQRLDGGGPVRRRDPGGGPVPVVHADREGGPLDLGVGRHHQREVEVLHPLGGEGNADQAGGVGQEEGDLLRGDGVGRHDQVAFVLAILVVDHHDDLPAARSPQWLPRLLKRASTPGLPLYRCAGTAVGHRRCTGVA